METESKARTPLMENDDSSTASVSDKNSDKVSRTSEDNENQPPDGGFWAWLVLLSCFLVNGIIFGIINTFGILFVQLKKDMDEAGVEDAATKCGNNIELEFQSQFEIPLSQFFSFNWLPDDWDNFLLVLLGWNSQ